MIGCTSRSRQKENQEKVVERDTAYMIEPFLRDAGIYVTPRKSTVDVKI